MPYTILHRRSATNQPTNSPIHFKIPKLIRTRYDGPLTGKALQAFVTERVPTFQAAEVRADTWQPFLAIGGRAADGGGDDDDGSSDLLPGASSSKIDVGSLAIKVVLVTNKDEAPGVYSALALNFRNRSNVVFGWLRAGDPDNKALLAELKPPSIPYLMMLMALPPQAGGPSAADPSGRGVPLSIQPFNGPLKYNFMKLWLVSMVNMADQMAGRSTDGDDGAAAASAGAAAAQELVHVASPAAFETSCSSKIGLCIVAALDPSNAKKHEEALGALRGVIAKRQGQPLHFMSMDGRAQRPLLSTVNIMASDMPTLLALSPRKMRCGALYTPLSLWRLFNLPPLSPRVCVCVYAVVLANYSLVPDGDAIPASSSSSSCSGVRLLSVVSSSQTRARLLLTPNLSNFHYYSRPTTIRCRRAPGTR